MPRTDAAGNVSALARRFAAGEVVIIVPTSRLAAGNPAAAGATAVVLEVGVAAHYADQAPRRFDYLVIVHTGQAFACNDADLAPVALH